jgi:hypothetical protein
VLREKCVFKEACFELGCQAKVTRPNLAGFVPNQTWLDRSKLAGLFLTGPGWTWLDFALLFWSSVVDET